MGNGGTKRAQKKRMARIEAAGGGTGTIGAGGRIKKPKKKGTTALMNQARGNIRNAAAALLRRRRGKVARG